MPKAINTNRARELLELFPAWGIGRTDAFEIIAEMQRICSYFDFDRNPVAGSGYSVPQLDDALKCENCGNVFEHAPDCAKRFKL